MVKDGNGLILEERAYDFAVLYPGQYFYVFPNEGSISGGTYVHLFANEPIFKGTESIWFTLGRNCYSGKKADIVYSSPYHILLKTPPFPEEKAGILIAKGNPAEDICQEFLCLSLYIKSVKYGYECNKHIQ